MSIPNFEILKFSKSPCVYLFDLDEQQMRKQFSNVLQQCKNDHKPK